MKDTINTSLISLYDLENNAVRSISSTLRKDGFRVFEIYFKNWINNYMAWPKEKELNSLIGILRETDTELVGISLRASAYLKVATLLTEKIKEALGITVVWGGIHPTLVPEECIEIADIVCVGEAEYSMLGLVKNLSTHKPLDMVPNLWIRTEQGIKKNSIQLLIKNLDVLPLLDYTSKDKYYIENGSILRGEPLIKRPLFRIMASRGCFYRCSFCYNSGLKKIYRIEDRYFRYRSVENIITELLQAKQMFKKLKYVRFDDEMFIFDNKWIREFCREYKRKIDLPFECFLCPGNYEEDLLADLKDAGLRVIYMGIEGSERINRTLYNRRFSEKEILRNAEIFHKLKLDARYQIILDDPLSDETDKREFFEFLMRFPRPFEFYLFSLTVFPKTDLAATLLNKGLINEDDIEGRATKTFSQLRVDLTFPRPKSDQFWTSLIVLISKNFVPKALIYRLSKSRFLYTHPMPLVIFSQLCNLIKMMLVVFKMLLEGKITFDVCRQWLNSKSLITQ